VVRGQKKHLLARVAPAALRRLLQRLLEELVLLRGSTERKVPSRAVHAHQGRGGRVLGGETQRRRGSAGFASTRRRSGRPHARRHETRTQAPLRTAPVTAVAPATGLRPFLPRSVKSMVLLDVGTRRWRCSC